MHISDLQIQAYEIAAAHGWRARARSVGEAIALMHSELSEALEEWRDGKMQVSQDATGKPEGFPVELADCIIRICDTAEELGIDLEKAISMKMEYNKTRPWRHGGKLA